MRCSNCGTENPSSGKFCDGCGSALVHACATCGAVVRAAARFCGECGSPLGSGGSNGTLAAGQTGSASSLPGVVAERRLCSILFADLVGFTPLSESKDPEEVREILSRYFEVARRTISRYGGVVEKFIGDAVMAVWGAPVAEEGDTERAVRAALDLVDAVRVLGAEVGAAGLAARAGVVTGEVAVTIGAEGEGMVAGDAVNTASRVQSVARPGMVFVDTTTRQLSQPAISFSDEGDFELKGKSEPERLFSAVRVLSGVGGVQWGGGSEAPFTGRDTELRAIKDLFHACVERTTPRLVVVTGPAGVGKSRFGFEFDKYIDGLADTVLWHRGRCLSYGEGVAFWALSEIVRQRFAIAEEDPTDQAADKLREGLVRFVVDETERDYIGVRLSRLLGVPYPSDTKAVLSQDELYAGWRLFFEHLASVAPVVLVVEDAQHADESLLGFFDHLIDWTRQLPIFVLLLARPGHAAFDAGYGVGRNRSTLTLDPLDPSSMANLVGALVPGMPSDARDAITERAQGIPLFAVETVRSLIDQGVVQKEDDVYRLVGDLGTLSVPSSLHALLASRLDALPPEARSIAAVASVVGSSFPKEALVGVSGRGEDEVATALAELVRRDVLEIVADPLSPERGAYRFSQEMLRQVAYETLSKKDRKLRHLAVATHLRAAFPNDGEEIADAIARHYLDSLQGASAEPDAEQIKAEALGFLERAAQRAARSGAPLRAAQLYATASEIASPERSPGLSEQAANSSTEAAHLEMALTHARAAYEGYELLGELRAAARARAIEGRALQQVGRLAAARSTLNKALEVLRTDPDPDTVTALRYLAGVERFDGNATTARQLIDEALDLGQALGVSTTELAMLFTTSGIVAGLSDQLAVATAHLREAARLAERAGDFAALGRAQLNLADALIRSGDPEACSEASRSAMRHVRRSGQRRVLGAAAVNLVIALLELGAWDEAAAVLDEAEADHLAEVNPQRGWLAALRGDAERLAVQQEVVSSRRESEDAQDKTDLAVLDALAALCEGDVRSALSNAMRVLEMSDAVGIAGDSVRWAWPLAARAARALGDEPALDAVLAVLDAHPVGHRPPILQAERRLVVALRAVGDGGALAAESLPDIAEAVSALRAVGNPYQLAHALIDQAEVMARAGDGGVESALAQATEIAERLSCAPLLARADSVGAAQVEI